MNAADMNRYITEEMGLAEEQGENISIRFYLSNDDSIELWFDKDNDCYTWSNASYGYEDTYAVVQDICEWLKNDSLKIIGVETI